MDLAQIRYFISVSDHLSFSRAAEACFVSQPTISKQIALLEKELGVKLFSRNNQGVSLTFAGQALYSDFRGALLLIDTAVQKIAKTTADVRGQVNIGIGKMMDISYIMPGFLHAFSRIYPGIQLKISSHPFDVLQQKLHGGELDVIFTYSLETQRKSDQNRMAVFRSDSYLYYPLNLVSQDHEQMSLSDFMDLPLLQLQKQTSNEGAADYFAGITAISGIRFQHVIEVPDMETMILYLESGLGVCIIGKSYRINTSDNIRSINVTRTNHLPTVGTDAIWLKSDQNPSLKRLLEEMKKYTENRREYLP